MQTNPPDPESVALPDDLLRAVAIGWIDKNFGMLSGLPSTTDRLIQCFIGGAQISWENATATLQSELAEARAALQSKETK